MLYIIGLGLNVNGISREGLEIIKNCNLIYLENYTVDFPYSIRELEKIIGKKIIELNRKDTESNLLIKKAKKENIGLLIYGSPLFATTHISLINDCNKTKTKYKIVYSASIFDAIAETGLQLYKFGKISSIPKWEKNFNPHSFLDFVIENKTINAHSLILSDVKLEFKDALYQLKKVSKEKKIRIDKLIVCSCLGTDKNKIYYGKIKDLINKKIKKPFCFIIPEKMHFIEKEFLNKYKI